MIGMFLCDNQSKFLTFLIHQLKFKFSGKRKLFFKKLECRFLVETTKIESTSFPSKLVCHKPMSRQIEWQLQNRAINKSRVLPVTTFFFWKICFSFRTS